MEKIFKNTCVFPFRYLSKSLLLRSLKIFPKAACNPKTCTESQVWHIHWRNSTNVREEKPEQKIQKRRLSEQSLELTTVFKEATRNFIFIFLFKKTVKRLNQGHLHPLLEHPETKMSRPGIVPRPPASQASTLAKSYSNSLWCCYSEPLQREKNLISIYLILESNFTGI